MDPVSMLLLAGAIGAGLYGLTRMNQAADAKQEAAWSGAARMVSGSYTPAAGPWYRRAPRRIEATLDRIDVVADSYVVSNGKSATTYTRLTASVPNSHDVVLSVYREGLFTSVGKALGAQDVVVGDPAFDELFVVKANVDGVARAWLHGSVCAALRACPDFRYQLENGTLRATCVGLVDDGDLLARAVRVVAKLAARGAELEDEWARAASRVGGMMRRSLNFARAGMGSFTVSRKGTELVVAVARDGRDLVTTLSAPTALTLDAEAKAQLTEAIGGLQVAWMELDQAPSVLALRGLQRDPAVLDRILDVLAELAGDRSIGPYR